ncbi:MAG: tetratricopeptide repeat protein [Zoogloeaceae bacterium]|nr:tetratricopeptide repeat protein [Zoogloeaceae bacterium]
MADAGLDDLWQKLRPHLEWAEGFSLVLLFGHNPKAADALRVRLEGICSLRTQRLQKPDPRLDTGDLLKSILKARPRPGSGPLWVDLTPVAQRDEKGVGDLLMRLNERRFLLESEVRLPLVLILPGEFRARFHALAPDLWAVRSFSDALPLFDQDASAGSLGVSRGARDEVPSLAISRIPSASEREWQRLFAASSAGEGLDLADAAQAFEAAIERGAISDAKVIAAQALAIARVRARKTSGKGPQVLRDLSIALDNVGRVARDLGDLSAARVAFEESLSLRRQLREALGEGPQVLRDLSVSLDNVGGVAGDLGDLSAARVAFEESLSLRRQLAESFPDIPRLLRDLERTTALVRKLDET